MARARVRGHRATGATGVQLRGFGDRPPAGRCVVGATCTIGMVRVQCTIVSSSPRQDRDPAFRSPLRRALNLPRLDLTLVLALTTIIISALGTVRIHLD